MATFKEWLDGKKTIIVQVIAVISAVVMYWNGSITKDALLTALWAAFSMIFFRKSIDKIGK